MIIIEDLKREIMYCFAHTLWLYQINVYFNHSSLTILKNTNKLTMK